MRRSCLLGLTLFLLLGLLAACGEAPDKENPRLPASEACLTGRVAAVEGAQLLVASLEEGAGESDVYAVSLGQCPVAYQDPDQGAIRPGDRIQVGYGGTVEETFPARLGEVTGILVEASGFDDLCALPSGGPGAGPSTTEVTLGLDTLSKPASPAEERWQRSCPVLTGTFGRPWRTRDTSTESEWSGTTASSSPLRRRTLPGRSPSPPRNGEAAPAPTGSPTAPPARTHPATGTAIPWAGRRFRRKREKG